MFSFFFQDSQEDTNGSTILINPSMVPAGTPLAQQPIRTESNNPSNVQGGNETFPRQLTNDNVVNDQPPINLFLQGFSQIMNTNPFNDDYTQRSDESEPFRTSDHAQDEEPFDHLISHYSHHDQQRDENVSKSQVDEISFKESQEQNAEIRKSKSKSTRYQPDVSFGFANNSQDVFQKKSNDPNYKAIDTKRPKESETFRPSDQTQDEEPFDNFVSQFTNTNLFSDDYSRHNQQREENLSKSQINKILSKESQEQNAELRKSKSKSTRYQPDMSFDTSNNSQDDFRKNPNRKANTIDMQRSKESETFKSSDQTQHEEPFDNLVSQFMNTNLFSDYSQSQEQNAEIRKGESTQSQPVRPDGSVNSLQDRLLKKSIDPKENIRKVLNKCYSIGSNSRIEYNKDLAKYIPGLYRLLDLYKDDGSNGLGNIFLFFVKFEF